MATTTAFALCKSTSKKFQSFRNHEFNQMEGLPTSHKCGRPQRAYITLRVRIGNGLVRTRRPLATSQSISATQPKGKRPRNSLSSGAAKIYGVSQYYLKCTCRSFGKIIGVTR